MSEQKTLMLIEDDEVFAQVLSRSLAAKGLSVTVFQTFSEAQKEHSTHTPDYIVLDLFLEDDSGMTLLPQLRGSHPHSKILILTGYASIATTVQAMKLGADNYLPKPANATQILQALEPDTDSSAPVEAEPLSVERLEWEHIQTVLAQNQGNISATARALGMHRRTLQRKLGKKPSQK
ncbi:response regulator transcription factor [Kangiella shandongensis]|uniref:response regulator transcription factor n=1 Tax=Kangiella shandongensis TaxID=2763258 RepID=UPI001CBE4207|nr:response regulator [Kangiella shandongensis]